MPTEPTTETGGMNVYVAPVGTPLPTVDYNDWSNAGWQKLSMALAEVGKAATGVTHAFQAWGAYTAQDHLKDRLNDILKGEDPGKPEYRYYEQRDRERASTHY